jgi:formiminoglutamase
MYLKELSHKVIDQYTHRRIGERRIGQCLLDKEASFSSFRNKFAIIGIPESIGPRANGGRDGAENAWSAFLKVFLNSQVHDGFAPSKIAMVGEVDVKDIQLKSSKSKASQELLRSLIEELDLRVKSSLEQVFNDDMIPIVIGGGHNNALPIIQAAHETLKKQLQVWNFDPHADLRPLEGRHSGNPFSYAHSQELLLSYTVLGFEEAFNNQYIYRQLIEGEFKAVELLDLFPIEEKIPLLLHQLDSSHPFGLDIDMDFVNRMPASAYNPVGMDFWQLRKVLRTILGLKSPIYFHLPEAAPSTTYKQEMTVGKTLTLLVRDFIRFYPL